MCKDETLRLKCYKGIINLNGLEIFVVEKFSLALAGFKFYVDVGAIKAAFFSTHPLGFKLCVAIAPTPSHSRLHLNCDALWVMETGCCNEYTLHKIRRYRKAKHVDIVTRPIERRKKLLPTLITKSMWQMFTVIIHHICLLLNFMYHTFKYFLRINVM